MPTAEIIGIGVGIATIIGIVLGVIKYFIHAEIARKVQPLQEKVSAHETFISLIKDNFEFALQPKRKGGKK